MPREKPIGAPWLPFRWDAHIPGCVAIQALHAGTATPEQQQLALRTIIEGFAGRDEFHFHESQRDTDFALGKAWVGQQLVKVLKLNMSRIKDV